jgi:hypothetical protein
MRYDDRTVSKRWGDGGRYKTVSDSRLIVLVVVCRGLMDMI